MHCVFQVLEKIRIDLCLVVLLIAGCQEQSRNNLSTRLTPIAPTFEERVDAIRRGETSQLRMTLRPLLQQEYEQLLKLESSLTVLEIDQSQLDREQLRALLQRGSSLTQLKLVGPIVDDDLLMISETVPQLRVLNIPDGQFRNAALRSLSEFPQLELLRFSSPHVDDAGLAHIQQIETLRFLHLIAVPITDAGLSTIADMPNLESFYLDAGQCTEDGLSQLIKQRPDLHFHWNQLHLPSDPQRHPHQ